MARKDLSRQNCLNSQIWFKIQFVIFQNSISQQPTQQKPLSVGARVVKWFDGFKIPATNNKNQKVRVSDFEFVHFANTFLKPGLPPTIHLSTLFFCFSQLNQVLTTSIIPPPLQLKIKFLWIFVRKWATDTKLNTPWGNNPALYDCDNLSGWPQLFFLKKQDPALFSTQKKVGCNSKMNKTGVDRFQDCSRNWSLNVSFCFYGCKKGCHGYYVILSSNH